MRSVLFFLCFICSAATVNVYADDGRQFGIYLGAGTFKHDGSGLVASEAEGVDLSQDLGLGDDQSNQYYLELNHGVEFLPKLRVDHVIVEMNGRRDLGRDIVFNGVPFDAPAGLTTEFQFEQTSAALFYRVFEGQADIDVGVSVRQIEGDFMVVSTLDSTIVEFDETVPLLYTRLNFEMYSGWWFEAEVHGVEASGNQLLDVVAKLGWQSPWNVGLEVGYRELQFELDSVGDITEADFEIAGPYFGLNYRF